MARHKIGDRVRIALEPVRDCDAGWDRHMSEYCGMEATITSDHSYGLYWRIDIDGGKWWWSDDCFIELCPELPDLDPISPEALSELYR